MPKPKKWTNDAITRAAFTYAERWLRSLVEANAVDDIEETQAVIEQMRQYRRRKWGLSNAERFDLTLANAKYITVDGNNSPAACRRDT
jgi:hypothetical protein